jgi:uncharacterized protein (TIGR03435 family)
VLYHGTTLITYSYEMTGSQLVEGPNWLDTETQDIDAKADHSMTRAELAPMLRRRTTNRAARFAGRSDRRRFASFKVEP